MLIKVINDHNLYDMRFDVSMRSTFCLLFALRYSTLLHSTRFDSPLPLHSLYVRACVSELINFFVFLVHFARYFKFVFDAS